MEREETPRTSRIWLVVSLAICAVLGVIIVGLIFAIRSVSSPIPSSVRSAAHFTLYYPDKLTDGYTLNKPYTNYDQRKGILVMEFKADDHSITLTQQAAPASLNFEKLKGQGTVVDGAHGQAAISDVEGRKVVSMLSDDRKTLIIVNSKNASDEELTHFARALVPAK